MDRTAIVFYCKVCHKMFFVVRNEPDILILFTDDIAKNIADGHRMAEVDDDEVRQEFGKCICVEEEVGSGHIQLSMEIQE